MGARSARRAGRVSSSIVAIGLCCALSGHGGAAAQESCAQCHATLRDPRLRQPIADLAASVHADQLTGCSDCHGGDPNEPTVRAHDPSKGFRSRIEAGSMPETCGTCHSDPSRFSGTDSIPTDQLARYLGSVHGQAFVEGNLRAAACWDCHGHHLVLPPDDPRSTVHTANVAETCGGCHASPEVMAGSELPTDQPRQYAASVHGLSHTKWVADGQEPLTGVGPDHPPTCNDCHGEHTVGRGEQAVSACEGCHADIWEAFRSSPHREAFETRGFLPCVDCHGSHEVRPPSASLVGVSGDASCRRCHRAGQEMTDTIAAIGEAIRDAEEHAARARKSLDRGASEDDARALTSLREREHALRVAFHALDLRRVEGAAQELEALAAADLGRATPEVREEPFRQRVRVVTVFGAGSVLIALLGLSLWLRKRT